MATFVPIHYNYVPTAPRSRSKTARRKFSTKQPSILNENSRAKPIGVTPNAPRPPADVAADENGSRTPRYQVESSSYYNGGNDENDDDYFPTIEELLHTELRKEGFGVAEPETI